MIGIGLGIAPTLVGGASSSWSPPLIGATAPTIFADFSTNQFLLSGTKYPSFSAWLTALSGTYTRASTATSISSGLLSSVSSGVPRISSAGIRLTGSGTNQLLQSNAFTTTPWGGGTGMTKGSTGPDGVVNSAWAINSQVGATNLLSQTVTAGLTGSPQTASIFVKQNTATTFVLECLDTTASSVVFIATFTWTGGIPVGAVTSGSPTFIVTPIDSTGWYRVSATATGTSGNNYRWIVYPETSVAANNTGAGNFFYGAQLDNAPFVTDYIPTTTSTATQAADALSFPYTQTTFTGLVRTISIDPMSSGAAFLWTNTFNSVVSLGGNYPTQTPLQFNGAVNLVSTGAGFDLTTAPHKFASSGDGTGRAIAWDGGHVATDTNAYTSTAPASLVVGGNFSNLFSGSIRQIGLWNGLKASSAQLQALTT